MPDNISVVQEISKIVTVGESRTVVNVVQDVVKIVTVAEQGPPGIQGPPGPSGSGSSSVIEIANSDLSGGRVVQIVGNSLVDYADKDSASVSNVLGITLNAAIQGDKVNVQTVGEITEPTWNWTLGSPIFLGNNGQLMQTVPTRGYSLQVAIPVSPTKINVAIMPAILLVWEEL